jgi:hypothetical protein
VTAAGLFVFVLAWACLVRLASPAPPSSAQAAATAPDRAPTAVLAHVIRQLTTEARKSRSDGALVRNAPTFADDLGTSLPPTLLIERLMKRIDDDPFIDAYVRWQLTGFEIQEFAQTDAAFDRTLRSLPEMLASPSADASLIQSLNRSAQAGQLTPAQQEQANAALNDLAARTSAARALNFPGLEFRDWLISRCEKLRPDRSILLAMERAGSLAAAGWPIEDAKHEVDTMLERAARRREFTREQRQDVLEHAAKLVTTGRLFIVSARVSGEALAVEYSTTGIFDFDVRRWEKMVEP